MQRTYQTHFEGVIPNLQRRYREATTDSVKEDLERYMAERPCPACHGRRLKPEALAVTVADRPIDQVTAMARRSTMLDLDCRELAVARRTWHRRPSDPAPEHHRPPDPQGAERPAHRSWSTSAWTT